MLYILFSSNITLRLFLNLTANSEYADSVTEHWLRQTPPNPMVQYALAIFVFVVSVPSQRDTKFDIGRPKRKSMLVPPPSLKL